MKIMSIKCNKWIMFSGAVEDHIENYVVPQYGDEPDDIAAGYSAEDCIKQVQKYAARFGRNSRSGQQKLDLYKMAHYLQMAANKLDSE